MFSSHVTASPLAPPHGGAARAGAVPFSAGAQPPCVRLPEGACDSHIHFYDQRFAAVPGARLLPPDASVRDYRQLQRRTGLRRAVVVTPSTYGTDNRPMLQALQALGDDARGVAVIEGSESAAALARMHAQGVRGVRLNLSLGVGTRADMLAPLAERIAPLGWHLQLLMAPDALCVQAELLARLPVPIVFDHFARLAPADAGTHAAHGVVLQMLRAGRAWIKLSGGYIVSPSKSTDDPALDALARSFLAAAPRQVVWGSDWPHATASAGVQPMPDDARQLDRLAHWTADDALLRQVLVDNPARLYGFPPSH
ncbi:amidohydrolase family protein [Acidovorax sp. CCYZU-2555]|uniref:amidohydrolase family protein n=1 Tax=Acidovorax sp. CCYZU-2555 TaxID=2835042 RepID=UPI001BCE6815|nr:amidohydrolase family protein [Acidovorax sp. CCYZU-2555]MBS7780638.1 amidohydrolase family protein [Acidovorax sp. CCYZU-2555]